VPGAQRKPQLVPRSAAAALLLTCLALATPARAQACDQFDSAMTEKDLAEVRKEVQSHLPARYFDAIGTLAFETVEPSDEDSIFPRAIPSLNRVEIPSDYYRVHCEMISFTERLMRIPKDRKFDVLLSLLEQHRACLQNSSFNFCFRQSLKTEIADLEPETSDEQAAVARIRDAFFLVIAHEIAHVLIRERYPDGLMTSLDHPELAADALSLQAAVLADRDYRRASLTLFPASFFDVRGLEFEHGPTELILTNRADSSCRSTLAFATGASWGPEISAARRWAFTSPLEAGEPFGSSSLTAEADRIRRQMVGTGAGGLDFDAICQLPSSQIETRGRDYRSVLVEVDRVNASSKSPDVFVSLLRFQPQSDTTRSFLHTIIVYRILNEMMAAHERKDLATERQLFETLRQLAPQMDRNAISSVARGLMSMFLGLNRQRFASAGSSLDEVISAAESELLDAERFLIEAPASLSPELARLRLLQGDCAGAGRRYALLRNSNDAGIAAEAERFSNLEQIGRSSCEAVVSEMRSELRARRGWR
jgi:hypothetical protein